MTYLVVLDIIGTLVFAISGALTAANKEFDLMGISIIAFVTALGGGTLRDLIIGIQPVSWTTDVSYIAIVGVGVLVAFLFRSKLEPLRKAFFVFDAMGLAVFSIGGLEVALMHDIQPVYAVFMGMISATMGGVTRDVLCQVTPLIFRDEIYASAGLIGALAFLGLSYTPLSADLCTISTILLVLVIRVVAVRYKIGLPKLESP